MPKDGHYINRSNWLRAAMLGANDGIVSMASLLVGVSVAGLEDGNLLLTGLAGLSAGAFSMAAGEYVSVSAQSDVEAADLERERRALDEDPDYELSELAEGLEMRGVASELALQVAAQMTEHDALDAHAREELGLHDPEGQARPLQAAGASAVAFALGGGLPLLGMLVASAGDVWLSVVFVTLLALIGLGGCGARLGGAPMGPAVLRVLFWGVLAMSVTSVIGHAFSLLTP
ncbi:VIT family protein [Sulfitobacter aestuarii]|uniref:VIT family protein n=1 Tax=Sulfitobacter aestuarii TaxID=2161676 RepID=A0ABW5U1N9_9RHOB